MRSVRVLLGLGLLFAVSFLAFGGEKKFVYDDHGRKDPLMPVVDSSGKILFQEEENSGKKVLALRLQGIIYRSKGPSKAIIEKKLYKVGDRISGLVITEIYPDHVVLSDGKDSYELWLKPNNRKGHSSGKKGTKKR